MSCREEATTSLPARPGHREGDPRDEEPAPRSGPAKNRTRLGHCLCRLDPAGASSWRLAPCGAAWRAGGSGADGLRLSRHQRRRRCHRLSGRTTARGSDGASPERHTGGVGAHPVRHALRSSCRRGLGRAGSAPSEPPGRLCRCVDPRTGNRDRGHSPPPIAAPLTRYSWAGCSCCCGRLLEAIRVTATPPRMAARADHLPDRHALSQEHGGHRHADERR